MRTFPLCAVAIAATASSLSADLLLSDYNLVALDSAQANAYYGVKSFGNPASTTSVVVPEKGFVRLIGNPIASDSTEGYTANIGLLHPLRRDWRPRNLTGLISISFEMRYDAKPSDGMEVAFGSDLIPKAESDAGHAYTAWVSGSLLPSAVNTWKWVTLSRDDFTLPSWWTPPTGFISLDSVLTSVKHLQFAPKTTYTASGMQSGSACAKCVTPATKAIQLDIRNVSLTAGFEEPPLLNPIGVGCENGTPFFTLDDFTDGDNANDFGGTWFAYSDTSTSQAKALDSARGSSNVELDIQAGDPELDVPGAAIATLGLHKKVGGPFDWRRYAGWGAVSTDFGGEPVCAIKVTGFSFQLRSLRLGPQVQGITFKVAQYGVPDEEAHQAFIPAFQIDPTGQGFSSTVCVDEKSLVQPIWVSSPTPFVPFDIRQLTWEARIADDIDPSIADDTAAFSLTNVRIYGAPCEGVHRAASKARFQASYRNGILELQRLAGYEQVVVMSTQGRVVARLQPGTTRLALPLDRGTWFVVARNARGESISRTLAVFR